MKQFVPWIQDLADKPLPGSVAAAAVAGAMGAALIVKALRLTLEEQELTIEETKLLEPILDLAREKQAELLRLVEEDTRAYQALLDSRKLDKDDPARRMARHEAVLVPLQVATACAKVLSREPIAQRLCWPPVKTELRTGTWLLESGQLAAMFAADVNQGKVK